MVKLNQRLTEQHVFQIYILNREFSNVPDTICVKSIMGKYCFSKSVFHEKGLIHGYLNQTGLMDSGHVFQVGERRGSTDTKWWTINLEKMDMLLALGVAVGEIQYQSDPEETDITKLYVKRIQGGVQEATGE